MSAPRDRHGRPLEALRLSVTDRCNLRCSYCMPEPDYTWLPRTELLDFDELTRVTRLFVELGVRRLRLTGGEPLLRKDLPSLVSRLRAIAGVEDLALTTNGLLLAEHATALREAGLDRLTVSLDTLDRARFKELSRVDGLTRALGGLAAAKAAGFSRIKLDTVVLAGVNDGELLELLAFARDEDCELRFIEYMDVGGATRWREEDVVSRETILARVGDARRGVEPVSDDHPDAPDASAPARRYRTGDGQLFGVIASTTAPFCAACDRSRVTADGHWFDCLYAAEGLDLRAPLREGASDQELRALLRAGWEARDARGAERRLELARRGPQFDLDTLLADPRLEMHTKGG